jgi:ATP-dependent Lhr-like helicase
MSLSSFHPTVQTWFRETLGTPTAPQRRGWPLIRSGTHTLIAAPTGSGKTLAAFLSAIDGLFREALASGDGELPDETRVLYVSPLKALGNDVQKNLARPLEELRLSDPSLPELRVMVRSGDTTQGERTSMKKRPPHLLVTTPESLYILLTSDGGRAMLRTVRTVIVDEIHAVLGDKRGAHLALSLERLDALASAESGREVQRIGLSATQKPLEDVGRFLVGEGRACELVDEGHLRAIDLEVEIPPSPLETVCSHETWAEVYERVSELIAQHRSTLVFVGTRKMSERVGAELSKRFGDERIASHHSSLSKERRLDAEERLKQGELSALVATASLELGIDVGDVDLVCQIGTTRSIANLLQRVGRSGHGVGRTPRGRLFPLTIDELVDAAALASSIRRGVLDRTPRPRAPLDILAQQVVAACVPEDWDEEALYERLRRAHPYRDLAREDFERCVALHTVSSGNRNSLLHRDGVHGRLRATRRARLAAITSGGAIPDSTQYRVLLEPEGTLIGTLDEDFAIEASGGDVFQLGNASWRVLRVEKGTMRVADARGAPPSLPFWFGEAPARTRELSAEIGAIRELGAEEGGAAALAEECGLAREIADELARHLAEGKRALGAVPTPECIVLERFFDESGGTQLVVHAPYGGRINRAFGLALRKRFCRSFGFELQAAADEDSIVLSLGPQHSFPLDEVFDYLHPDTVEELLKQAVLPLPMFSTRWRWNVTRSLLVERFQGGKKVPAPLLRMRADDQLVAAFPDAVACGETLPAGDLAIPEEHPLVGQTIEDCLREAMDVDGLVEVLHGLRGGRIRRVAIDTPEPSPFARSILSARPYSFLDDAPLEERRTQAVLTRRVLDDRSADTIGALDPAAVALVREQAWPDPRDAEEVHEALLWMGFVEQDEAPEWTEWLLELERAGRVRREGGDGGRWFATEATRDPKAVLRGRMEALGPVTSADRDEELLLGDLERDGAVMRVQLDGKKAWCDRRLLARIQRLTLEALRKEIEPVQTAQFLRFLGTWQHLAEGARLEGPEGVFAALTRLAAWEAPTAHWEKRLLAARVERYRPEWLDQLAFTGRFAWGRLWGSSKAALRATPVTLLPREDLATWMALAPPVSVSGDEPLSWQAHRIHEALSERGALFTDDLATTGGTMLPSDVERGLEELIALGLVTSDSFVSLRQLLRPPSRRHRPVTTAGRWSLFRPLAGGDAEPESTTDREEAATFVALRLLERYGVLFRALLERERQPLLWRDLARALRRLELRGDVRGGRFVAGYAGEQFALPQAVTLLRRVRREESGAGVDVASSDPLNLEGILTPGAKVPSRSARAVPLG